MKHPLILRPLILLIGLSCCFVPNAFSSPDDPSTSIPSDILPLLEQAEDLRCRAYYVQSNKQLKKAQALYRTKGNELAALQLYSKILWLPVLVNFDADDFSKHLAFATKEISAKLDQYPALEAILFLAQIQETWIHEDLEKAKVAYASLLQHLEQYPNWDYAAAGASYMAAILLELSVIEKTPEIEKLALLSKNLLEKNVPKTKEKNPYLYRLYPNYQYLTSKILGDYNLGRTKIDVDAAVNHYSKAITLLQEQKLLDSLHMVYILFNFSDVFVHFQEELEKAKEYLDRAKALIPTRFNETRSRYYHLLGFLYLNEGDAESCISSCEKGIAFLNKVSPKTTFILRATVVLYRDLATYLVYVEKYQEAQNYLQLIAKLPPKADQLKSWTHATWGFIYENMEEYDKALEAHMKSIEAYRAEGTNLYSAYWNLAQIATAKGDLKLATHYHHLALLENFTNWDNEDFTLNPTFEDIIDLNTTREALSDKLFSYFAYVEKNHLWAEHGKHLANLVDLNVQCFEASRNIFDLESSKHNLLETSYILYEQAIVTYINLYKIEKKEAYLQKAIEFAEHGKSVLLDDALKDDNALSFAGIPQELIEKEEALSQEIAFLEKELHLAQLEKDNSLSKEYKSTLFDTRQELEQLKKQLESQFPKYYNLKYSKTNLSAAQIQAQLPPKTAIIEFFEGQRDIFVFGLSKEKILYLQIPLEETFFEEIASLKKGMSDASSAVKNSLTSFSKYTDEAFNFYQKYLQNVIPEGTERLIIVPDGMFNYIAFEALLYEAPAHNQKQGIDFKTLPYWVNKYTTSYNYSANMWAKQLNEPSKAYNNQILAMAAAYDKQFINPNTSSSEELLKLRTGLSPIPGTIAEISILEKNFGGLFYTSLEANESTFKKEAGNYGILHLAMHGLVNSEKPAFSSMAFTEDGKGTEDNFLHANEIKQLDLNANLVVLSACETGFGKFQHGEGVISLGRSFMYAGVPSLVMTLWKINDNSSIFITEQFYHNLQQGMEKDLALQKAKQAYLNYAIGVASHPAFWAAFVQLGDARAIQVAPKSSYLFWAICGGLVILFGALLVIFKKR